MRHPLLTLVLAGLSLAGPSHAVTIDNFESGAFSFNFTEPDSFSATLSTNAGHTISPTRFAWAQYYNESSGTMSGALIPQSNVDDQFTVDFPSGLGAVYLLYEGGGPWDLTEGGNHNRITIRATGGGPGTLLRMTLFDGTFIRSYDAVLSATGNYQFPFTFYPDIDPTTIEWISVQMNGDGIQAGIRDISTSSGSEITLIYGVHTPTTFYFCNGPSGPRGGGPTVGWNWALDEPTPQTFAGPSLQINGVSGSGCEAVAFNAFDSGPGGGYGPVGLVEVDWQAATFDDAQFEMHFVADPNMDYDTWLVAPPEVTVEAQGFSIRHEVEVTDVPEVPDGRVYQELIVAAAPGQELFIDYVEALPLGFPAGHSLSFGITAALVDPVYPILEIYTTGSYADDAGVTGVIPAAADRAAAALTAHPSITRTETRFVVSGETVGPAVIDVLDVTGRRIRQLEVRGGEALWNGTGSDGSRVPAGVYFARTPGVAEAARVVFLR